MKKHDATEKAYTDEVTGHTMYVIDGQAFRYGYAIVYLTEACYLQSYEAVDYLHEIAKTSGIIQEVRTCQ